MKKKVFVLAILAVLSAGVIIHTAAFCEFWKISTSLADLNECQVSVKSYGAAHSFDVVDSAVVEEICQAVTELQYNGIFCGREVITLADQAYSLIISSREFHVVLELSNDLKLSRINGNIFKISIKNYDELYGLLEEIATS